MVVSHRAKRLFIHCSRFETQGTAAIEQAVRIVFRDLTPAVCESVCLHAQALAVERRLPATR
jgi:hypothetical protein